MEYWLDTGSKDSYYMQIFIFLKLRMGYIFYYKTLRIPHSIVIDLSEWPSFTLNRFNGDETLIKKY